jgi:hypothetical protein
MDDIPVPEPQPAPSGPGPLARWQPLFTLVIAITAIALALWEGLENRRHNRLSVVPRIGAEMDAGTNPTSEFVRLGIESNGLGPAVVTAFRIYFDGELQDTADGFGTAAWQPAMEALQRDSVFDINAQGIGTGYFLPPGRAAIVFEATRPRRAAGSSLAPLVGIFDRLAIQICYCSVYHSDCDVIETTQSVEMAACPTAEEFRRRLSEQSASR